MTPTSYVVVYLTAVVSSNPFRILYPLRHRSVTVYSADLKKTQEDHQKMKIREE